MYDIRAIKDFDQTDVFQQLLILQNAKELLAYLNDEHEGFPYAAYMDGSKALLDAMNFIDDEVIHGGI